MKVIYLKFQFHFSWILDFLSARLSISFFRQFSFKFLQTNHKNKKRCTKISGWDGASKEPIDPNSKSLDLIAGGLICEEG